MNDLQSALEQLKACANGQGLAALFSQEALALLDERDALRTACESLCEIVANAISIRQELDKAHAAIAKEEPSCLPQDCTGQVL